MLLLEHVIGEAKILESDRTKLPDGVLCRVREPVCNVDQLNANKRRYGWDVWERVIGNQTLTEQMQKRALFGHAEHPATSQSDLQLVSHAIIEWVVDKNTNTVYQVFDVFDTPTGRVVDCLLRAGCKVGVSTRAEGELTEEVDEKTKEKYQRVIAESYKYITTDFTADPSTFGAIPIEIKRNVVTEIKAAAACDKANASDKQFAGAILESMKCVDENTISVVADPNGKVVNIAGDVNSVTVNPTDTNTTNTINAAPVIVTVISNPPAIQPQVVGPVEDEPVEDEPVEPVEDDKKDEIGESKINEEVEIWTESEFHNYFSGDVKAFGAEIFGASKTFRVTTGRKEISDAAEKILGPVTTSDKYEDVWIGFMDDTLFKVVVSDESLGFFAVNDDALNKLEEYIALEKQWLQPAAEGVPNESKSADALLREITQLRIVAATVIAERDRLIEKINGTLNKILQSRIVVSKLREMRGAENSEITALRAKLEEKAAVAADVTKRLTEANNTIKTLNERVNELTANNSKITEANKSRVNDVENNAKKVLSEQVNKAKTDATRAVILEYVGRQLKSFKSVHGNVRALLEGCVTIAEVDEVLNEFRDSQRRSALHSQPPKEITVRVDESKGDQSVRKRVGLVFDGFGMK